MKSQLYSSTQIAMVGLFDEFDQLYQYFCVCIALESVAMLPKCLTQYNIIFDYAVVNQCERFRLGIVRVCIDIVGFSVCGPSGMRNADGSGQIFALSYMLQIGNFSFGFEYLQLSIVMN